VGHGSVEASVAEEAAVAPFLPPVTEDVRLDLVETRTFGSRVTHERYGRARDASD
jgi:hypothetical protein